MENGRLRHRVDIKSITESQNTTGDTTVTASTLATVWADVRAVTGKEFRAQSGQQKAVVTHEVVMRYRSDVTARMRLVWGTKTLEIRAILPDRVNEWMRLECGEAQ